MRTKFRVFRQDKDCSVKKKLTNNGRVQLWTDCSCGRLTQRFPRRGSRAATEKAGSHERQHWRRWRTQQDANEPEILRTVRNFEHKNDIAVNLTSVFDTGFNENSARRDANTARCFKAEPKNFAPPQTPFPAAQDGQNLISWRWSLFSTTYPVWWRSMHAISSYRGNRPTQPQTHNAGRPPARYRQDR